MTPPPLEGGDDNLARSHHSQRSPQSPVTFSDGCFHPLRTLFPPARRARRTPCPFQPQKRRNGLNRSGIAPTAKDPQTSKRSSRAMNKEVQELELAWNAPEEPAKSKLDSWYFRSSRHQVDTRTSVQFFPTSTISSLRRGLRPNRRASTQRHRPCFLRWTERKPPGMCACPPSRRLSLHTCALHRPKPWARYQLTLQTMQDDSPSSQQGLLLGWGGSLCSTCYGGASRVAGQAPAVPGGRDHNALGVSDLIFRSLSFKHFFWFNHDQIFF